MRKTLTYLLLFVPWLTTAQTAADTAIVAHLHNTFAGTQPTITDIADTFVGTPYVAHTLDQNDAETLVIDLTRFDCQTFVETVLALWRTGCNSFDTFADELRNIRYRDGQIDGFASRLHYLTEWIRNNEQHGIVRDITDSLGGQIVAKQIDFMTTHSSSYRQLRNAPALTDSIRRHEIVASRQTVAIVPKHTVADIAKHIPEGAIVAIATDIAGLDYAHVGFAVHIDGRTHLLHASSNRHCVCITTEPLAEYLNTVKHFSGISIIIPQKPQE
ncbi:MAG: N-acetylmuramoyl-L-alanine amidase-like domain-containing protein [Paludibacteraceae bacterium]